MEIRTLSTEDYEAITDLWSRANLPFRPKGRDSRKAMAAQMKTEPDFFLGAYEGEKLIGAVIITCEGRKGWINRLAVDPDHRHHGLAKALIAECERILRKRGIRLFCALIDDGNAASKRLFKECGYVEHHDIIYFSKRDSEEV
ncbi:MAG TPA: GNAT family N-acetyltransferase [Candidatus Acidoferrum sp.]|jgi:ribosomal protein S18 acetylase RimI-like enzyme|nr:GNAT family N-acetyltransferase [Candidatus Acidoferrum sp.]